MQFNPKIGTIFPCFEDILQYANTKGGKMHHSEAVTVNPYLTFNGNCQEAMTFYQQVLGGELEIMPFEGSPADVPDDYKHKVMHAALRFGQAVIMASDGMPDSEAVMGDATNISLTTPDVVEGERLFNGLSNGGTILMPFEEMFWGDKFGMLIDKFGVRWMVSSQLGASPEE